MSKLPTAPIEPGRVSSRSLIPPPSALMDLAIATVSLAFPVVAGAAALLGAGSKPILERIMATREEASQQVLLRELRDVGAYDHLAADPDAFVSRAARYYRVALTGAAHTNLRILARLVVAGADGRAMPADEFLSLSSTIESLRHDELIVLAELVRAYLANPESKSLWAPVAAALGETYPNGELQGLIAGLARTGFVYLVPGYSGGSYRVTPILMRLEATAQFTQVVAEETLRRAESGEPLRSTT